MVKLYSGRFAEFPSWSLICVVCDDVSMNASKHMYMYLAVNVVFIPSTMNRYFLQVILSAILELTRNQYLWIKLVNI